MREQVERSTAKGISRRNFAAMSATVALAGYVGTAKAAELPVRDRQVRIGAEEGRFFHPAEGRHPGVVLWVNRAALGSASAAIAGKLAAHGMAVLVVSDAVTRGDERNIRQSGNSATAWLAAQDVVAQAGKGYVLRTMGPMVSLLTPRGKGVGVAGGYMLAAPPAAVLTQTQRQAIAVAVDSTHRLSRAAAGHVSSVRLASAA